jgi:hypothetical protein
MSGAADMAIAEKEEAAVRLVAPKHPGKRPGTLALQLFGQSTVVILDAVGARFGVTWEELLRSGRGPEHLANARHVAAWLLRRRGMSYPAIGRALGGRDHTTIMSACAHIDRECAEDPAVAAELEAMAECGRVVGVSRVQ